MGLSSAKLHGFVNLNWENLFTAGPEPEKQRTPARNWGGLTSVRSHQQNLVCDCHSMRWVSSCYNSFWILTIPLLFNHLHVSVMGDLWGF